MFPSRFVYITDINAGAKTVLHETPNSGLKVLYGISTFLECIFMYNNDSFYYICSAKIIMYLRH